LDKKSAAYLRERLIRVKTGNTLIEQKISALTPKADVCAFMSTRPNWDLGQQFREKS
jgi:hypothetical protein